MSTPTTTILITGANQGLGFETARQLSKHANLHIFLVGRDPTRVQEAQTKITTEDGCQASIDKLIIDVSDDESIKAGVEELKSKLQGAALDVLVVCDHLAFSISQRAWLNSMIPQNNSGIAVEGQISEKGLRRVFEETYAVNVFGAAVVADSLLPLLKQSKIAGGGRIVNISSGLGSIATMADPNGQYKDKWFYVSYFLHVCAIPAELSLGVQQ